ncbi:MAG: hypothetical protein PGN34_20625 [Methylobacterium frigidaeris]
MQIRADEIAPPLIEAPGVVGRPLGVDMQGQIHLLDLVTVADQHRGDVATAIVADPDRVRAGERLGAQLVDVVEFSRRVGRDEDVARLRNAVDQRDELFEYVGVEGMNEDALRQRRTR